MIATATVREAAAAAQRGECLLDVREPAEHAAGHPAGALLMPLALVPLRIDELDRTARVLVICQSGARAHQACAYLASRGFDAVLVDGGIGAWQAAGLPLTSSVLDRAGRH